ncbi:MAG: hypothetical protein K2I75_01025 [Clostridiales bacterium]|nr:hypothetical protein [Clostridiales bacterium]
MVYNFTESTECTPRYEIYSPQIISYKDIEDSEKNLIITPETGTVYLKYYKHARKLIWWLGVHLYFKFKENGNRIKDAVKHVLNCFIKNRTPYIYSCPMPITDSVYHACGSQYAYDFLISKQKNIKPSMLVEPISKQFYDAGMATNLQSSERDDVILYNPSKPSRLMEKLLLRDDLKFRPLKGFTPEELVNVYRGAKLYIDFGEFSGPERIPKESVFNGTCLLVGKRNASVNDFDIPIPQQYKIEDFENEQLVVDKIKYILQNYDECIGDFNGFRTKIQNLETTFKEQINNVFTSKISG